MMIMAAESPQYAVQMKGISKFFGSFCALNHVNLDVKRVRFMSKNGWKVDFDECALWLLQSGAGGRFIQWRKS